MPGGTLLAAYVLKGTTDEQNRLRFLVGDKADDDDDPVSSEREARENAVHSL